ncbi:MAG: alpha/beta hydrolase [Panacagrimonas sp.]
MMQAILRSVLRGALRVLFRGVIGLDVPERFQRRWMNLVTATTLRAGSTTSDNGIFGVPGAWIEQRDTDSKNVLLYLHGGGYTLGSHLTHKAITSHLAAAAQANVLAPDYRLAPEHPYPAGLHDALAAYRHLLDRFDPQHIAIGGDSAGGGLALCTALALREAGLPQPAALLLISPWTDLSLSGETIVSLKDVDPLLSRDWLSRAANAYRGELALTDPRISPLFADPAGLPPTLIQVGSDEILLGDSRRFAESARAAGVNVRLEVEAGMWHDFQLHAGVLRTSDAAIRRIAQFLGSAWPDEARQA